MRPHQKALRMVLSKLVRTTKLIRKMLGAYMRKQIMSRLWKEIIQFSVSIIYNRRLLLCRMTTRKLRKHKTQHSKSTPMHFKYFV